MLEGEVAKHQQWLSSTDLWIIALEVVIRKVTYVQEILLW